MTTRFLALLSIICFAASAHGQQFVTAFLSRAFAPNPFSFTNVTGASPSTVTYSNSVSLAGVGTRGTSATCSGCDLEINGDGVWSSSVAGVRPGNTLRARLTSSSAYSTTTNATINIGGVAAGWSVQTRAAQCVQLVACIDTADSFTISGGIISHSHLGGGYNVGAHSSCGAYRNYGFTINGGFHSAGSSNSDNIPAGMTMNSFSPVSPAITTAITISGNTVTINDSNPGPAVYTVNLCE